MKADHVVRGLNEGPAHCTFLQSFNTTYNFDNKVPTHTGIMFEMAARSDIEILTFELDVRLGSNILASKDNLAVEVYTTTGNFDVKLDQPDTWLKIVDTQLVISELLDDTAGSYNAIIPVAHFQPVIMETNSRRSFYVTTHRVGSVLDNTVFALDKTGELASENEDVQIYVGAGFQETSVFSGIVDRTVNPKFAGVVHYRKIAPCNVLRQSTTVQYPILIDRENIDDAFLPLMTSAILEAVTKIIQENIALKSFFENKQYGFVQIGDANTFRAELSDFDASCPEDWKICPAFYVNTVITYTHDLELDSLAVQYEFYQTSSLDLVTESVQEQFKGVKITYIGLESVGAAYNMTFFGNRTAGNLDQLQQEYFSSMTKLFLNNILKNDASAVCTLSVDEKASRRYLSGNTSRMEANDTIVTLKGVIRGISVAARAQNFDLVISKNFRNEGHDIYLSMLKGVGLLPTSAVESEQNIDFFPMSTTFTCKCARWMTIPMTIIPRTMRTQWSLH
jgi:hypothetical protein